MSVRPAIGTTVFGFSAGVPLPPHRVGGLCCMGGHVLAELQQRYKLHNAIATRDRGTVRSLQLIAKLLRNDKALSCIVCQHLICTSKWQKHSIIAILHICLRAVSI